MNIWKESVKELLQRIAKEYKKLGDLYEKISKEDNEEEAEKTATEIQITNATIAVLTQSLQK